MIIYSSREMELTTVIPNVDERRAVSHPLRADSTKIESRQCTSSLQAAPILLGQNHDRKCDAKSSTNARPTFIRQDSWWVRTMTRESTLNDESGKQHVS